MTQKEFDKLLERYSHSACTAEEIDRLEICFLRLSDREEGKEIPIENEGKEIPMHGEEAELLARVYAHIRNKMNSDNAKPTKVYNIHKRWISWAAVIFLLMAFSFWIWKFNGIGNGQENQEQMVQQDVPAAQTKALLSFSKTGSKELQDKKEGWIAFEDQAIQIRYTANGVVYIPKKLPHYQDRQTAGPSRKSSIHRISTSNAQQYRVVLSDGSIAYLNAGSSIRFPSLFEEQERKVQVTGEVFFEVASSPARSSSPYGKKVPFIVETEHQKVEVLGTSFNIRAYAGEMETTSLASGKLLVRSKQTAGQAILHPGETAYLSEQLHIRSGKTDEAIAWRHGDFQFQDHSLGHILKEIERWYDVKASCPAELENLRFSGIISRKQPLSAIIEMLNSTGQFQISLSERRLLVRK